MSSALKTVGINAAFLQEIKEDNAELRRVFSYVVALLAKTEDEAPLRELADSFMLLRDQLAMHFALEESFGYVDDAILASPRLLESAEGLRAQHETLYLQICDLVECAETQLYQRPDQTGDQDGERHRQLLADSFSDFHARFTEHENGETELILSALDDDIGVGD